MVTRLHEPRAKLPRLDTKLLKIRYAQTFVGKSTIPNNSAAGKEVGFVTAITCGMPQKSWPHASCVLAGGATTRTCASRRNNAIAILNVNKANFSIVDIWALGIEDP